MNDQNNSTGSTANNKQSSVAHDLEIVLIGVQNSAFAYVASANESFYRGGHNFGVGSHFEIRFDDSDIDQFFSNMPADYNLWLAENIDDETYKKLTVDSNNGIDATIKVGEGGKPAKARKAKIRFIGSEDVKNVGFDSIFTELDDDAVKERYIICVTEIEHFHPFVEESEDILFSNFANFISTLDAKKYINKAALVINGLETMCQIFKDELIVEKYGDGHSRSALELAIDPQVHESILEIILSNYDHLRYLTEGMNESNGISFTTNLCSTHGFHKKTGQANSTHIVDGPLVRPTRIYDVNMKPEFGSTATKDVKMEARFPEHFYCLDTGQKREFTAISTPTGRQEISSGIFSLFCADVIFCMMNDWADGQENNDFLFSPPEISQIIEAKMAYQARA